MPEVTDEDLAIALQAAEDDAGVDQQLARATAAMTSEQRRRSEENIQRWIEAARRSRQAK